MLSASIDIFTAGNLSLVLYSPKKYTVPLSTVQVLPKFIIPYSEFPSVLWIHSYVNAFDIYMICMYIIYTQNDFNLINPY